MLDKEVLHKSDVEELIGKRPFEEKKLLEVEETTTEVIADETATTDVNTTTDSNETV